MMPISNEKRALFVAAKQRDKKEGEIAKWLEISKSFVGKIWKLFGDTGRYRAIPVAICRPPYLGRQPILTPEKWEEIKALVAKEPDKTLDEIIEELALPIHKSRLSILLIKAGYSF